MAKLKTIKEACDEALKYVENRQLGLIKSLKLRQPKLDKAMIDGIEWNSTVTLGGRPSVGKSAVSDIFIEGALMENVDKAMKPNFNILDFNWELSSRVMLIRRISAMMRKSYKYVLSAEDNTISKTELQEIEHYLTKHYAHLPILFAEEPETVTQFGRTVEAHVQQAKTPTLVRVDHTLLCKQDASENSQVQMLLNLLMKANELKKKHPLIFLFLTQINREFEERQEDGTDKAFPRQGDVYGGDAAAMFSETILLLNRPAKYGITWYGHRKTGLAVDEKDLFMHIVKNRNAPGDGYIRYAANFEHMTIQEL